MTNKGSFKFVSFLITTALFGGIGYFLYSSIKSGDLFLDNDKSFIIEAVIILAPLVLTIIWSVIERRKTWIGAVASIIICTILNGMVGDVTTRKHIPLFILSIVIPYICCLCAIFSGRERKNTSSSYSSSSYSSSSDDYYSGSSYSDSSCSGSSSSSSYDDCGAYGYPAELGASYHPDHIPMDLSDM